MGNFLVLLAIIDKYFDGVGAYGTYMGYAMRFFFGGSAVFIFLYLWRAKKLHMDEEAKLHMLQIKDDVGISEERHDT
ncbi:hypothetical protein pah_c198o049 [Parachlamydia acanthamoebae str. Hall's coccus]|nr:hypothetical protein pah_c198o049 [Parachlamydia acanthamoebae str. Hall's coccus]